MICRVGFNAYLVEISPWTLTDMLLLLRFIRKLSACNLLATWTDCVIYVTC